MRTCQGTARLQSTQCLSHNRSVNTWGCLHAVTSLRRHEDQGKQGRCQASDSDTSAAATPAAAASDPGLESFKALIGERRFTCTQCGKCCKGAGEVWVSDAEAAYIARYLNLPLVRFLALHCRAYSKVEGFRLLRSNMDSETRDCTFLRPDNTCAIHAVRPLQCSTYPWWPELRNEKEWQLEKDEICEGFDHPEAPPTDLDAAAQQLKLATMQEYQKRLAYKPSRKQSKKAAAAAKQQAGSSSSSDSSSSSNSSSSATGSSAKSIEASSNSSSSEASWQERLHKLQGMLEDVEDGHR